MWEARCVAELGRVEAGVRGAQLRAERRALEEQSGAAESGVGSGSGSESEDGGRSGCVREEVAERARACDGGEGDSEAETLQQPATDADAALPATTVRKRGSKGAKRNKKIGRGVSGDGGSTSEVAPTVMAARPYQQQQQQRQQ